MSIVLQGSTSGSITLQEPAIAGSTVLSLPATSGTLITTGSTGQVIPRAALPTGSVLQVVQGTTNVRTVTTSQSFVNTNLTATITPTSSSSRIVIFGQTQLYSGNAASNMIGMGINRNSTLVWASAADAGPKYYAYFSSASNSLQLMVPFAYTDSPSTTSATTYTLAIASYSGASVEDLGGAVATRHTATIILMEVA